MHVLFRKLVDFLHSVATYLYFSRYEASISTTASVRFGFFFVSILVPHSCMNKIAPTNFLDFLGGHMIMYMVLKGLLRGSEHASRRLDSHSPIRPQFQPPSQRHHSRQLRHSNASRRRINGQRKFGTPYKVLGLTDVLNDTTRYTLRAHRQAKIRVFTEASSKPNLAKGCDSRGRKKDAPHVV